MRPRRLDGPAAPAVVVLTSGTTGRPRAAVLSTAALAASADAWLAALPPATGWLLALGLGHVAGLGVVWRAALAGVPLVDPGIARIAAASSRRWPRRPAPSHVSLVPTHARAPARRDRRRPAAGDPASRPARWRADPSALVQRALAAGWPVVPTYGLTEAGSGVTALPTAEAASHPDSAGRRAARASSPDRRPGRRRRRRDPGPDARPGSPATSATRSPRPPPWTADGWLRTGDLGGWTPTGV